jgi:hypothetical protein
MFTTCDTQKLCRPNSARLYCSKGTLRSDNSGMLCQTSQNPLFHRRRFADDVIILCVRWLCVVKRRGVFDSSTCDVCEMIVASMLQSVKNQDSCSIFSSHSSLPSARFIAVALPLRLRYWRFDNRSPSSNGNGHDRF